MNLTKILTVAFLFFTGALLTSTSSEAAVQNDIPHFSLNNHSNLTALPTTNIKLESEKPTQLPGFTAPEAEVQAYLQFELPKRDYSAPLSETLGKAASFLIIDLNNFDMVYTIEFV